MSTDAHNAKIIIRNGVVTLLGLVKNSAEKTGL
jgi:osmotically-inducible protein OsmY